MWCCQSASTMADLTWHNHKTMIQLMIVILYLLVAASFIGSLIVSAWVKQLISGGKAPMWPADPGVINCRRKNSVVTINNKLNYGVLALKAMAGCQWKQHPEEWILELLKLKTILVSTSTTNTMWDLLCSYLELDQIWWLLLKWHCWSSCKLLIACH